MELTLSNSTDHPTQTKTGTADADADSVADDANKQLVLLVQYSIFYLVQYLVQYLLLATQHVATYQRNIIDPMIISIIMIHVS